MEPMVKDPIWVEVAARIAAEFEDGKIIPLTWLKTHLCIKDIDTKKLALLSVEDWDSFIKEETRSIQFAWLEAMEGLKNTLLVDHRIALKNIRGQGYMRLVPQQQTVEGLGTYIREHRRALIKAHQTLTNIRIELLSHQDRQENIEARATLSAIQQMSAAQHSRLLIRGTA